MSLVIFINIVEILKIFYFRHDFLLFYFLSPKTSEIDIQLVLCIILKNLEFCSKLFLQQVDLLLDPLFEFVSLSQM